MGYYRVGYCRRKEYVIQLRGHTELHECSHTHHCSSVCDALVKVNYPSNNYPSAPAPICQLSEHNYPSALAYSTMVLTPTVIMMRDKR